MQKLILLSAMWALSANAAALKCWAVASGKWTDNIWASTSGGAAGSCTAAGGSGLPIQGQTATIPAHVPGTAGALDRAIINAGVTVHIPAGVGVDLGETIGNNPTDSLTIAATGSGAWGAVVIDQGGLLRLSGATQTGDNYAAIGDSTHGYATLQVMPGGWMWLKSDPAGISPAINVYGRLYVGCGDQTAYPTPFCGGNTGGWVTASAASTLNFTGTLPTGLAARDLVELSPIPQPLSVAYPYNIDGITPPPIPPTMPITNDTGTSPMRTCGRAATCLVPNDTLLCVVAVSGSSVSVGWPQGGTTAQPYCTGAETAMAITDGGKGRLWLKKPAFFWGDPTLYTWNNSKTAVWSSRVEGGDAVRSGAYIQPGATGAPYPISNAAGTGPGRYGDNSLSIGTNNFGAATSGEPCAFFSHDRVTSSGCFVDYSSGAMTAFGHDLSLTGTWTFKAPTALAQTKGAAAIPSGTRAYNEMVFANADTRYIYGGTGGAAFVRFSGLNNNPTDNRRMAWVNNTVAMSAAVVALDGLALTADTPLKITGNSFLSGNAGSPTVALTKTSSYVDISHNYQTNWAPMLQCSISASFGYSSAQTFDHITDVNNQVFSPYYTGMDNYWQCNWTNRFSADNRITSNGEAALLTGSFSVVYATNNGPVSANNVFKNNYISGSFRAAYTSGGQRWTGNFLTFSRHHMFTVTSYDGNTGAAAGGYVGGIKVDHNIIVGSGATQCFNSGYNQYQHIDGLEYSNNTCIMQDATTVANSGGFNIGDTDGGSFTAISGLKVFANISGQGLGIMKAASGSGSNTYNWMAHGLTYAGWNAVTTSQPMYFGFGDTVSGSPSAVPNAYPTPQMYRTVSVTKGGTNYNEQTAPTRNITGVSIQNPTYATATTGCLRYTYASQSDLKLAWSVSPSCADGTTGFGADVQLNWGGAGTTYSVTSAAAAGQTGMTLTTSASSFTGAPGSASGSSQVPTGCPVNRWVWATSGAKAGTAYAITLCPGTYNAATAQLQVVPQDTTIAAGNIAVIAWEVRLRDGSGGTVDVGIDARALPTASGLDTGITLTPTDYCAPGNRCAQPSVISGLQLNPTYNVSNAPLVPIGLPMQGGSAEQALCNGSPACGGVAYFKPGGTAWLTAGPTGSYIGAVGAVGPAPPRGEIPAPAIW